jgi:hypothetical protein
MFQGKHFGVGSVTNVYVDCECEEEQTCIQLIRYSRLVKVGRLPPLGRVVLI